MDFRYLDTDISSIEFVGSECSWKEVLEGSVGSSSLYVVFATSWFSIQEVLRMSKNLNEAN
jgi:hypothetical protein